MVGQGLGFRVYGWHEGQRVCGLKGLGRSMSWKCPDSSLSHSLEQLDAPFALSFFIFNPNACMKFPK